MTSTAPPTQQPQAPPADTEPTAPAPAPTVTATWTKPTGTGTSAEERPRRTTSRGLPVGPTLAAAGNATGLTLTAAYTYGGPVAVATAGALVAVGATASAVRRRATVRRATAFRSGSGPRGGAGSGPRGSGGTGPRSGSRSGSGSATRSLRSATGGGGRSGLGPLRGSGATGSKGSATHSGSSARGLGATRGGGGRSGRGILTGAGTGWSGGGKSATVAAAANRAARATKKPGTVGKALAATGRATGRGLGRLWRSAPAQQARAALARQAKKAPGALWDGLLATGAGVLSGLWHWSVSAAVNRLREVWKRRRARRASKQQNQPAAAPQAQQKPIPATFIRRPAHAGTGPSTLNGGTMPGGGHHFVGPAMEMARAAAAYNPQGMLEVGADFDGLTQALELQAEAMRVTVENAHSNWPLDQAIVDIMAQIHNLQIKASELARELGPAFERLHDVDLARLRNPRKGAGEAMWDYTRNV